MKKDDNIINEENIDDNNTSKSNNNVAEDILLEALHDYKTVFLYNKKYPLTRIFSEYATSGSVTMDLSVHPSFEKDMIETYAIKSLPCIITNSYDKTSEKIKHVILYEDDLISLNKEKKKVSVKNCGDMQSGSFLTHDEADVCKVIAQEKLDYLLKDNTITIFIKGTPSRPECGFTRQLMAIIERYSEEMGQIRYNYFNIFDNEKIRTGIKLINEWPTIPQIYLGKKFIGGLDSFKEMDENGILKKEIINFLDKNN